MTTPSTDEPVQRLDAEECWELLEGEELGRLAYRLVDEVHIVPINYVVDGRSLLFRTASGNKLLAAALHSDVALEIDWHDDRPPGPWSRAATCASWRRTRSTGSTTCPCTRGSRP